jgi:hypothetical protein
MHGPPPRPHAAPVSEWIATVDRMFRPDELAVPVETFAFYLRLVAFGSSIPVLNEPHPFDTDDLADLIIHGILPATGKKKN